jgi:GMP synthase (glutamine-hydrolysing)
MNHRLPLVILQMGEPALEIRARHGEQPDWFRAVIGGSVDVRTVRPFLGEPLPKVGTFAAAIISGSAAMVTDRSEWSERAAAWTLEVMHAALPLFGVCYGHQLMAHALGGEVGYLPAGREMGSYEISLSEGAASDPLLAGFPPCFDAILIHQQSILTLPPNAIVLGHSDKDSHQIVRFSPSAFSVQFHPEFTPELITMYIHARAEILKAEGFGIPELLARVTAAPFARRILQNFVKEALGRKSV